LRENSSQKLKQGTFRASAFRLHNAAGKDTPKTFGDLKKQFPLGTDPFAKAL